MNTKIARIIGYALLTSSFGMGLASAQTAAPVVPSSAFKARKPVPVQSAPKEAKSPQLHLPGLAPNLNDLVVIMPANPPPLFIAAKGVTVRSRDLGKLNGGALVELGGYDR